MYDDLQKTPFRPSIETFLHSITQKYTLHTHPTAVNILALTENGWQSLKSLFPNSLFVEYETPGIKLAKRYFEVFKSSGENPDIIFLKNHGLVVSSDSVDSVIQKTEAVLSKIEDFLYLDMSRYRNATKIYDVTRKISGLKDEIVYLSQNVDVIKGIEKFGSKLWDWQFCPDCIVYLGKKALFLDGAFSESDFENHIEKFSLPVIVSFKGNVYILARSVKKAKEIESVLSFSAQVALANQNNKINLLPDTEQNFLLDWDSEKYRQQMK
ncbi:MAG: class II aldolase/adducin family protein [Treponema sp.]